MPKILIIEDMPDSAELAAEILRRYGHETLIAQTGEQGLSLAQQHRPDLIVYDYWLPDIDARTFIDRLRRVQGFQSIPIIACTATPTAVLQDGGDHGFNAIIRKPYRLSNFMEVIEGHLES